jgi:nucleotide-binding universal stress UspA family protein
MKKNTGIKRIVVGLDGSEAAQAAVTWTIDLASVVGADVVAVHAIEPAPAVEYAFAYNVVTPLNLDEAWRLEIKREFEDEWCRKLEESGLAYRTILADGRAADVVTEVGDRCDADLVVVGRRGRGSVAELFLGSVSHELSHRCRRPVVLISAGRPAAPKPQLAAVAAEV